jgi:glycosyltransferase involved in cell wall biosynthesis
MRIGIDFRLAGVQHGGIGRYVLELVKNLIKTDTENIYYLFYNSDASHIVLDLQAQSLNLQPVLVDIKHYSLAEQIRFPRILNSHQLDLMHFPNFNVPIFYKRPFIVTIHDLIHHKLGGVKKTNLLHFLAYKYVIQHAIQACKKLITVSEASKIDIINEFPLSKEKVEVIYEATFEPIDFSLEQAIDFKQHYLINKPYFLFVGVKQRNKNLLKLCQAFAEFLKRTKYDYNLIIAGKKDPHYPNISNECVNLCKRNLLFIEHFTDLDLEILYKNAFAFVSASSFEGFGLPGLEAMSRGLPLAVSNLPVFNEIYENGAIYFDPENVSEISDCLTILATDSPYYNQIRQAGLKRAEQFSWQKCAEETLKVYETLSIKSK